MKYQRSLLPQIHCQVERQMYQKLLGNKQDFGVSSEGPSSEIITLLIRSEGFHSKRRNLVYGQGSESIL